MKETALFTVVMDLAASVLAGGMEPRSHTGSKDFERMKTLAGVWKAPARWSLSGNLSGSSIA